MRQLFVGLMTEGKTDQRFLKPVVEKTLIQLSFQCKGSVDTHVFSIDYEKDGGFNNYVLNASKVGLYNYGISILVVHADADAQTNANTYQRKIVPAKEMISTQDESETCKKIVALVPIQETESWLLANKVLFKKLVGTPNTDEQLNISGHPERFANPKQRVEDAIRIGRNHLPRKIRESMKLEDIYSILGESLEIDSLNSFESYTDFRSNMESVFRELNLIT